MHTLSSSLSVGLLPPISWLRAPLQERSAWMHDVADAGIDHVAVGDHVSFFVGAGTDGLVDAANLLALHPTLPVHTAIYQLPLRHPVPVARQLATIAELAPGRLVFGVGIGGEDRHEIEICGVDPARRGRRMDESLRALRGLLAGQPTTVKGRDIDIENALVLPAPDPAIPILVGGRSTAAVRRAGRLGDGWLGIWVSARRFAEAAAEAGAAAEAAGRDPWRFRNALNVWCGFGDSSTDGRRHLAPAMEGFYQLPFERFERWSPTGKPVDVADFLAPYVTAGCTTFNLIAQAESRTAVVEGVAEVRRLLAAVGSPGGDYRH